MEDIANGATNQAGEMQKVNEQISDMTSHCRDDKERGKSHGQHGGDERAES